MNYTSQTRWYLGQFAFTVQDTEAAIRDGRHFKTTEAKRHTLGELIDRYLLEVMPGKPKSAKDQTRQLNWWKAQLGKQGSESADANTDRCLFSGR